MARQASSRASSTGTIGQIKLTDTYASIITHIFLPVGSGVTSNTGQRAGTTYTPIDTGLAYATIIMMAAGADTVLLGRIYLLMKGRVT